MPSEIAGVHELIVNLGDPLPANGVREFLIATGTPVAEYYRGGLALHVLREQPVGGFAVEIRPSYVANRPDRMFDLDLADLGGC
jgi:hypothetical protein